MKKHPLRDCAVEAFRQYAKNELAQSKCNLPDKVAVEKTLAALSEQYGHYNAVDVLRQVYFLRPAVPLKKGDIQSRVVKAAMENYISVSTVYRILHTARETFIKHRGDDGNASVL